MSRRPRTCPCSLACLRTPAMTAWLAGTPPSVFLQHFGACRRRMPRTRADPKVEPKAASHRDTSDAALRLDLAPRLSPSACPRKERLPKIGTRCRPSTSPPPRPSTSQHTMRSPTQVRLKSRALFFLKNPGFLKRARLLPPDGSKPRFSCGCHAHTSER